MRASEFITEQPVPPKKPGTIAVVNTPVADKSISMQDKVRNHRVRDFANQISTDNQRYNDYAHITKQTRDDLNSALKQADNQERTAMNKQAAVDARQGAGQSTISRVKPVRFNSLDNVKIAMDDINEQPVTTTNAQGVTTTVNKAANRVTTKDAGGTVVKDRTGGVRSIATPKIGGFQAKQTFRPDATPGYQQATYKAGGTTLDMKGSPETGYTKTVGSSVAGTNVQAKQRYSGQKEFSASANLGNNQKVSATSTISKPGAKPVTKMSISEFEDVQAAIREHVAKNVPFTECMFRPGSTAFTEFYRQVRECADKLNLDWEDQELIATDIGECIMVEGEMVALDVPMIEEEELNEAEYQGRKVELNKPKRGGSKKFYVYTKNKKGNVIKVSWGDTTGLSVKAKDRGAVKSFVARHKCKEKNDKTKAGYWACRTPRYKSLGVKGGQWW